MIVRVRGVATSEKGSRKKAGERARLGAISDANVAGKRTTRSGALCSANGRMGRKGGLRKTRPVGWVMYRHMYVIVAICRESERLVNG